MKRAQSSVWTAIVLATLAGTSLADVHYVVHEPPPPAGRELALDTRNLPPGCQLFLTIPADTTSELLPWARRLSVAACRQSFTLAPVDDPERFPAMIETLERAAEPSLATYRVARVNGPAQIQILAAYGLGMTHLNIIVRARGAVRTGDPRAASPGGAAHAGSVYLERAHAVRRGLEALLRWERDAALEAFRDAAAIADQRPDAARANLVMTTVLADARRQSALLLR
jgi:hypothetical protein